MPFFVNKSESTYERPGDGVHPAWVCEPGQTVECDTNPAPEAFEETVEAGEPAATPGVESVDQEQGHQE